MDPWATIFEKGLDHLHLSPLPAFSVVSHISLHPATDACDPDLEDQAARKPFPWIWLPAISHAFQMEWRRRPASTSKLLNCNSGRRWGTPVHIIISDTLYHQKVWDKLVSSVCPLSLVLFIDDIVNHTEYSRGSLYAPGEWAPVRLIQTF